MASRPAVDVLTRYLITVMVGYDCVIEVVSCVLCSPEIRTVLVCGPAGTRKTTAVKGAATVVGDRRSVKLPLNSTPEQIFGTIDLNEAISGEGGPWRTRS